MNSLSFWANEPEIVGKVGSELIFIFHFTIHKTNSIIENCLFFTKKIQIL